MTSFALGTRTGKQSNEVAYYEGNLYGSPDTVWPSRMDGSTAWICRPSELLLMGRRIDGDQTRHADIIAGSTLALMQTPNLQPDDNGNTSSYGLGWYSTSRHGHSWWQHNGAMAGTQAILAVRDDGEMSLAYATNSIHDDDDGSGSFRNNIIDLMKAIDDAGAWPDIDLFGKYHPSYDAWVTGSFGSAVASRAGLAEFRDPAADPDGDGIPNAAEFYHGLDPLQPESSPYRLALADGNLRIRWLAKTGTEGVSIGYRTSTNLSTWQTPLINGIAAPGGLILAPAGYHWRELRIPVSGARRFVRFEFEVR